MNFQNTGKKIVAGYGALALIILNSIIILLVLNLAASGIMDFQRYLRKRADAAKGRYSFKKYEDPVRELFPDLHKNDIDKLLVEIRHVSQVFDTYTQFKERPFAGKFVNVNEHGFRPIKNQGPWPPDPKNVNIFVFGGSTTFGYGVTDNETIPSYLQDILNSRNGGEIKVYNFGRGGYISVQEKILFEKLIEKGIIPKIAVFIDGLNDLGYGDDDPPHTKELTKFMDEGEKPPFTKCIMRMPIFRLIFKDPSKVPIRQTQNVKQKIHNAIGRYESNREIIQAVADRFGIKTVFVWQPVPVYKCDPKYNLFASFDYDVYMPYLRTGYDEMAKHMAEERLDDTVLNLADMQEGLHKSLYADAIHYSPYLCGLIAEKIADNLQNRNIVKKQSTDH